MSDALTARKVAFLGSAPSSFFMAPQNDPEWEIWACGPGNHVKPEFKDMFDRWFELHDMAENDPQYGAVLDAGYFEWLQGLDKPVYYRPPLYPGLTGREIPWDEIAEKHSSYFLDSTVAWMMAYLYEYFEVDEIGIWGIDFATDAERRLQRKGTKHFIELFRMKGVKCQIPEVSDMSFDPPPYPEISPLGQKLNADLKLLEPDKNRTLQNIENLKQSLVEQEKHLARVNGTIETLIHFRDNRS